MKQSATVAVGVLALGAFVLYRRSQRTTAPAVDLSATTDDLGVTMGPGGGLPAYRGLAHAWARTEPGEHGSGGGAGEGSGGESADAGASVYANASASAGTQAGDTGASLTLGGSGGGSTGGHASPTQGSPLSRAIAAGATPPPISSGGSGGGKPVSK